MRLGGDFSSKQRLLRSQCRDHSSNNFCRLDAVTSVDSSVRWDSGTNPKRPGPPKLRAAGKTVLKMLSLILRAHLYHETR